MEPINQTQLDRLQKIAGSGPVLILTHDNPDPDALASGIALATLLKQAWGIPTRLVYSGLIARAENQAMLRLLTPEWEALTDLGDLGAYAALAMVDSQPGAGNNSLPTGMVPQIVIDHHHPIRESIHQVPYVAVRPDGGYLLTGDANDRTALWDVERGEVIRHLEGGAGLVCPNCIAFRLTASGR